jgi:hypothetical protein
MYQQLTLFSKTQYETMTQIQNMQALTKTFNQSQLDSLSKIQELNSQINSLKNFMSHQQEQSLITKNQLLNQLNNMPKSNTSDNYVVNTIYSMGAGIILNYAFSFVVKNSISGVVDHFRVMERLPQWIRNYFIEKRELVFDAKILEKPCITKLNIQGDEVVSFQVKDTLQNSKIT